MFVCAAGPNPLAFLWKYPICSTNYCCTRGNVRKWSIRPRAGENRKQQSKYQTRPAAREWRTERAARKSPRTFLAEWNYTVLDKPLQHNNSHNPESTTTKLHTQIGTHHNLSICQIIRFWWEIRRYRATSPISWPQQRQRQLQQLNRPTIIAGLRTSERDLPKDQQWRSYVKKFGIM